MLYITNTSQLFHPAESLPFGMNIENALTILENAPVCISEYKYLLKNQEVNKTSTRSVRLALRPSIDICISSDTQAKNKSSQEHIDLYLADKPRVIIFCGKPRAMPSFLF